MSTPRRGKEHLAAGLRSLLQSCHRLSGQCFSPPVDEHTPTDSGNQSCPEASIPDLAVRIIRLFEELSLGSSESNLTLVFSF
jgi:hypothetical protein